MRQHYDAAELDQPVQIARKTPVSDGAGGYTETETVLPSPTTYHFAKVRPLRGAERLSNDQITSNADALFVLHRDIEVRMTDVLVYNGARYNVTLVNPVGRAAFQEIEATRGGVA